MKANEQLQDRLTAGQVARELGVSQTRVAELARKGRLEFVQTPLGRLFSRLSVERIRREREERAAQKEEALAVVSDEGQGGQQASPAHST